MTEKKSAPQGDERIAHLQGDRLCIKCAYNLAGQHIVREAHYGMLIVRCPECGTVASVQEYPLLGRWAGRWAVILAGLWLAILFILWPASSGILLGFSQMTAYEAAKPLMTFLGDRHQEWIVTNDKTEDVRSPWDYQPSRYHEWTRVHEDWWEEQSPAALRKDARASGNYIDWRSFWPLVYLSFITFPMGVVWACLLPHVRRRWLPLAALAIGALAWCFWLIGSAFMGGYVMRLGEAVHAVVGGTYVGFALLLLLIPLTVGLLIGRSVLRLAIRALLPPRLRCSLAAVWAIDGLDPPVPGKVRRS